MNVPVKGFNIASTLQLGAKFPQVSLQADSDLYFHVATKALVLKLRRQRASIQEFFTWNDVEQRHRHCLHNRDVVIFCKQREGEQSRLLVSTEKKHFQLCCRELDCLKI